MRPFFLFRLRARADFSFAFWPGGIKNACFFASLIISSVITLRLKRRNALSIDSPGLIVTIAILSALALLSNSFRSVQTRLFNTPKTPVVKYAENPLTSYSLDLHAEPREPTSSRGFLLDWVSWKCRRAPTPQRSQALS